MTDDRRKGDVRPCRPAGFGERPRPHRDSTAGIDAMDRRFPSGEPAQGREHGCRRCCTREGAEESDARTSGIEAARMGADHRLSNATISALEDLAVLVDYEV